MIKIKILYNTWDFEKDFSLFFWLLDNISAFLKHLSAVRGTNYRNDYISS